METQLIALRKSIDESSHACVSCMTLVNQSRPPVLPPPAPTNNTARSSARHRGAFQAAKWGCGVIVLDVRVCVFCLQIPHIVARRGGYGVCVCVNNAALPGTSFDK